MPWSTGADVTRRFVYFYGRHLQWLGILGRSLLLRIPVATDDLTRKNRKIEGELGGKFKSTLPVKTFRSAMKVFFKLRYAVEHLYQRRGTTTEDGGAFLRNIFTDNNKMQNECHQNVPFVVVPYSSCALTFTKRKTTDVRTLVMDVIKMEPGSDPLAIHTTNADLEEKKPLSEEGNLLDLDVTKIKTESIDHRYDVKSETSASVDFPMLKSEVEIYAKDSKYQYLKNNILRILALGNEFWNNILGKFHR
ncbi:hypothetical protein ANN_27977 [Periplaneta americana]|uniref:Uncharacterized protein n=1 Tax=Periplaneta americana TaxID=6978 RepID=A0ABQ8RUM4_PERAM|nr:hypothetical protein ANN_27977 [Periplaneta americana]